MNYRFPAIQPVMVLSRRTTVIYGYGMAQHGWMPAIFKGHKAMQVRKAFKVHKDSKDQSARTVLTALTASLEPLDHKAHKEKPERLDRKGHRAFKVSKDHKDPQVKMVLTVLQSPSKEVQRRKPNYPTQGILMAMVI